MQFVLHSNNRIERGSHYTQVIELNALRIVLWNRIECDSNYTLVIELNALRIVL